MLLNSSQRYTSSKRPTSPSRREGRELSSGEGEARVDLHQLLLSTHASPSPGLKARLSRRESEVVS